MLGIRSDLDLQTHPMSETSWEGYIIKEVLKAVIPEEVYYWATHNGAYLDLLLLKDGHCIGVECKQVDGPRLTPSMRTALEDLELDRIFVIYPGKLSFPIADQVTALSISVLGEIEPGNLFDSY